ncbi:RAMP superfamily CRISPR-associated protein [Gallibacterium genomosp. 3]|uniref:CRISPR system Cms protein Csm5 n=1 Tax=Gallibacterium genomosp. 3 TaxID=505345 RepID=A0A1A7Q547_9PAST|nr:RAMP superfamily CRISPR-associated protein [Gallibacterium genomosp. 3]OBX09339.1 hypothetical protein QV07_05190 [Gallibacterium genomosp. 3]
MTIEFMQNYHVYLTPLSPIHIGCGEDFEPTNYVIDKGVLYHFEPSQLYLSKEQKNELLNLSQKCDLLSIQRFFKKNAKQAIPFSHYITSVSIGIEKEWEERIGQVAQRENSGKKVISNLAIERNAYLVDINEPYIPGSSFKGALATTLLDKTHRESGNLNTKEKHKDLLKKYLGEFKDSKLRLVKFGDFMPTQTIQSQVYYSLNFKKQRSKTGILGKGIPLRRECIVAGQFHSFKSELSLWKDAPLTIKEYFKLLTEYYLPIFEKECEQLLIHRLISPVWVKEVKTLLSNGNVALVRLGKNGADSKIYQAKGMARIKIMTGKSKESKYLDRSTTVWLAGNNNNQKSELYPFGWALLEIDNGQENEALKNWCEKQSINQYFDKKAFFTQQAKIKQQKQAELEAELTKKQAKEAQRLAEEQTKQALLSSASANQLLVIQFIEKLENTRERQADTTGSSLLKEAMELIESAVDWTVDDQCYLKQNLNIDLLKSKIDFKKKDTDKNIKKKLNKIAE